MSRVTRWYPVSMEPIRIGNYEVRYSGANPIGQLRYWNGKYWVPREGMKTKAHFGRMNGDQWRGLKEPV